MTLASSPARDPLATTAVQLEGVEMHFGGATAAVKEASFALETGRFLTILGPSGSGKTTLLRMIAGFAPPTRGTIRIHGRAPDAGASHQRSIGMVFQKLALFPHMTVAQNVAFPLKMRRFDPKTIANRVEHYLELVRLGGFGKRRIHELSGGQQQRVAIARALVFEPDLLLLDEPLAALDRKLREEMQLEFRRIQKELGVTTINVTHDQREALVVSDEIIVMDHGRIMQHASPLDLYRRPENPFVAGFVGISSFIPGEACPQGLSLRGLTLAGQGSVSAGQPAKGAIRAEQIRLSLPDEAAQLDTRLLGTITDRVFEGERLLYFVHVPDLGMELQVLHHDPADFALFSPGDQVALGWNARDLLIFPGA